MVPAAQSDLFAEPRLAGLAQAEDIVTQNEEQALIASIDAEKLSPFHFHGWFGKRLTASFGWNYDFDTARLAPTAPIPDWLFPVRERAARFACLRPGELVQALLIRYDPGAGIGWHRDRPVFEHVVGISLGGARDDAIPTTQVRRLRSGLRRVDAPFDLPSQRRSAAQVGAQHRRDGRNALVDNLPQPGHRRP